jgi:DNA processing protein
MAGVGRGRSVRLAALCGSAADAVTGDAEVWRQVTGADPPATAVPQLRQWADRELDDLERLGARLLVRDDPDYPAALHHIAVPPPVLYVWGEVTPQPPAVAVVGPRAATAYGRRVARSLAQELAAAGVCVVSGLAVGVDSAAHVGALDAGGTSAAVLGCGLDVVYPSGSEPLRQRLRGAGALVTEFGLGVRPQPHHFLQRNRLISGLSRGVVLVETPQRSGALNTAMHAREQGREVMVVPGSVLDGRNRGGHDLLRDGAALVERGTDILAALRLLPPTSTAVASPATEASRASVAASAADAGSDLWPHLRGGSQHIDQLAAATGRAVPDLLAALLALELDGRVRQSPPLVFSLAGPLGGNQT